MIHFEVRWLHCGGFALQSLPSLHFQSLHLLCLFFFCLGKKGICSRAQTGAGTCVKRFDWTVHSEDDSSRTKQR